MERLACLLILVLSLSSQLSGASDVNTIDSIINTYYAVISGPAGFKYDADRDKNLHAEGAIITPRSNSSWKNRPNLAAP